MVERSTGGVAVLSAAPIPALTDTTTVLDDFELTEKLPEQAYFWTSQWQEAERQADKDIKAGRTLRFSNAQATIAYLHSPEV